MPPQSTVPEDVQTFLRERIRSFEELETLLLLRRLRPDACGAEHVGEQLKISSTIAEEALEHLRAQELLELRSGSPGAGFAYRPKDPVIDGVAGKLADAYRENRIEVMRLMTSNAMERLRGSAVRTFADAFLVGRKRDG